MHGTARGQEHNPQQSVADSSEPGDDEGVGSEATPGHEGEVGGTVPEAACVEADGVSRGCQRNAVERAQGQSAHRASAGHQVKRGGGRVDPHADRGVPGR